MRNRFLAGGSLITAACLLLSCSTTAHKRTPPASTTPPTQTVMTMRASGTFEVKLSPLAQDEESGNSGLGRMAIDKQFHGDLDAHSQGQMLTAMTSVEGSAGYVAMEHVRGTLNERSGTFVLQHSGTMTRGAQHLRVTVVPDSATGELEGLSGEMTITISEGQHFYEFTYTLDSGS